MRRPCPTWLRIAVSVLAVPVMYWPFAMFWWTRYAIRGAGPGPDDLAVLATAPAGHLTCGIDYCVSWIMPGLGEAAAGSIVAILIYTILTRLLGTDGKPETRCRRCRKVLRGLAEPRCPACGEEI